MRGGLPPLNFSALLSRFWNTAVSSGSSASTSGRCPVSTVAPVSSIAVARLFLAWASAASLDTSDGLARGPAHPAVLEQVVDQRLHPLGAVHGELDVLVGPGVQLARVAALQQLGEARHLAQRLLQVVRGDVGELLELGVRALQLLGVLLQDGVGLPRRGQLVQDALAHGVHVRGQVGHFPRTGQGDLVPEVAVGHLAGLGGEPVQRPDRRRPQAEREQHHDGREADRDRDEHAVQHGGRVVQGRDGLGPGGRDVGLQRGYLGPQRVEIRLAGQDVRADHGLSGLADLVDGRLRRSACARNGPAWSRSSGRPRRTAAAAR